MDLMGVIGINKRDSWVLTNKYSIWDMTWGYNIGRLWDNCGNLSWQLGLFIGKIQLRPEIPVRSQ